MSRGDREGKRATLMQYVGLWGYKLLCGLLRITDVRLIALLGRGIGYLIWACAPSRRRIVARNFRIILDPMLRKDKLNPLVRRNMVRTAMNLACSLKTGLMTTAEAKRAIRMEGADLFQSRGVNGHTVISCIPHAGNWEILARIRPYFTEVEHFGSMYRRMSNPLLEEMVYKSRTRYGCEMFSKEDGLRAVLRLARTGGLLGVLSDQFTQEGLFLPYFGKVTGVTPLPALLYKRCKGKGHLFNVFTRNTGLGKWDAVLGREMTLPEGCDSLPAITLEVNKAIERCQMENIIDGFWMHHRWKATAQFAPKQEEEVAEVAATATRLPFRIIVALPESFEEALMTIPMLRRLKASRFDAQLTVVCPVAQQAFWQDMDEISYTVSSDGEQSVFDQLEADDIYKDGPFDYLFMFSENKRVFKSLRRLMPIFISGFEENPLGRHRRFRVRSSRYLNCEKPRHAATDYLMLLRRCHALNIDDWCYARPDAGCAEATGNFIAPFSTLGAADRWDKWGELVQKLGGATLLALPEDRERAEQMAAELGIAALVLKPEEVAAHLGTHTHLYAVDGLLPHLAALAGCPVTVIMAGRSAARYAPLGEGHRVVFSHRPCHPCGRKSCDMPTPCTADISVDEMLG